MALLGSCASCLFVTTAKFLQEQIEEYRTECLDEVLNALAGEVLEDINALCGLTCRSQQARSGLGFGDIPLDCWRHHCPVCIWETLWSCWISVGPHQAALWIL